METKINIWGEEGCLLPNGNMCTMCCHVRIIPELNKHELTDCPHQCFNGCRVRSTSQKPDRCKSYHCSDDPNPNVLRLYVQLAETQELITSEQARLARIYINLLS